MPGHFWSLNGIMLFSLQKIRKKIGRLWNMYDLLVVLEDVLQGSLVAVGHKGV